MNVVGIIAEYNPMHNGHIYHINQAKKLANAEFAIVVMSGSFTEQGNVAVLDKISRAELAIKNGADMVIELPTIYATSSSENFALGAVNILNSLNIVTHLAFGAECNNILPLENIAKLCITCKNQIVEEIKKKMKSGTSSANAYAEVIYNYLPETSMDVFLPNNILAIEYLKALISLKSEIKPVLVHRLKTNHSDSQIPCMCEYASSTSIREVLKDTALTEPEKIQKISKVVPENTLKLLESHKYNTNEKIWNLLKYAITKLGVNGLKQIHEVSEGLENKIYDVALKSQSYNDFIFEVKSKRYALSRIKRICVYILLGITKEKYANLNGINYARILKVKKESTSLLSLLEHANLPIITKVTDKLLDTLDENLKESIKLDILATNISSTENINIDYTNKITQP